MVAVYHKEEEYMIRYQFGKGDKSMKGKNYEVEETYRRSRPNGRIEVPTSAIMWVLFVAAIVIIIILLFSIISVPAGHKGVVVDGFGIGHVFNEGWNLKNPLSGVELVRYNTQRVEFIGASTSDDNTGNIVVNSKDNVAIYMDFQVVFHLDSNYVSDVRVENGDFVETIVIPICRSVPRDVCANFDALEIRGESRGLVSNSIKQNITAMFAEKHIVLEEFALQEITLPLAYEDSITAKKVAEQNVITEQYNLEAQQYIANKEIIDALASANVTIIDATAKATAVGIIMNQFNITDQETASQIYLQWLYVRALTDPNSNVQYVMGDGAYLLNLSQNITTP
jgi:regulator of protease activity HflC (stomatin/prohibitin superfamily)